MTLTHLLVFAALALVAGGLLPPRARGWLLLAVSVLALYWLQPLTALRYADFLLPTATIALTVLVWALTQPVPVPAAKGPVATKSTASAAAPAPATVATNPASADTLRTTIVLAALVLAVGLPRYLGTLCCLTPARPPDLVWSLGAALLIVGVALLVNRLPVGPRVWAETIILLLLFFVVLKIEPLSRATSAGLRLAVGQVPGLATPADLRWLGYSYLAFRLIHVLRDRALGRLPNVALREFVTYALFFPAYTAGPIDRVERFVKDARAPFKLDGAVLLDGGTRIVLGVLKKFVLADSLALVALNAANAGQSHSALWTWVLVYAYAWRLYLDFSGFPAQWDPKLGIHVT